MKSKKLLSLVLVVAMALSGLLIAPAKVSLAASSKKVTMIKGEKMTLQITRFMVPQKIASAKSSKKSVVKIKKKSKEVIVTAKKAGKATVTLKAKGGGSFKWKITVKANKVSWKTLAPSCTLGYDQKYDGVVAFQVINKTGVYIPTLEVTYAIKGQSGAILEKKTKTVSSLVPGKKAILSVPFYDLPEPISAASCGLVKFKIGGRSTSSKYKYTNRSSKVSTSISKSGTSLSVTFKNKVSATVDGYLDVVYYNASNQVVWVSSASAYLTSKAVSTRSISSPVAYDHYKTYKRFYSSKYVG